MAVAEISSVGRDTYCSPRSFGAGHVEEPEMQSEVGAVPGLLVCCDSPPLAAAAAEREPASLSRHISAGSARRHAVRTEDHMRELLGRSCGLWLSEGSANVSKVESGKAQRIFMPRDCRVLMTLRCQPWAFEATEGIV